MFSQTRKYGPVHANEPGLIFSVDDNETAPSRGTRHGSLKDLATQGPLLDGLYQAEIYCSENAIISERPTGRAPTK